MELFANPARSAVVQAIHLLMGWNFGGSVSRAVAVPRAGSFTNNRRASADMNTRACTGLIRIAFWSLNDFSFAACQFDLA